MKIFIKFTTELFRYPYISIALKLPSNSKEDKICYKQMIEQADEWFKKNCAYMMIMNVKDIIETEAFAKAVLPRNLSKLFDTLELQTWSIDPVPAPTDESVKADIVKCFLFALHKSDYITHSVLKNYLKEEKYRDHIFLFKKFLEKHNVGQYLDYHLSKDCDIQEDDHGNFNAEAWFEKTTGYGFGPTKHKARQAACRSFLKQWIDK